MVVIVHHPHLGHVSPVLGRVDFVDLVFSGKQKCSPHIDHLDLQHDI